MLERVKLSTDLCIVGGGMAGISAAIAAARSGIRVVLIHERSVLGGNSSSEIRMWVCGARGKNNNETGLIEEISLENLYRNPTKNHYLWDAILFDFVKREKNITLLLNATCMDADTERGDYPYGRNIKIKSVTAYQMTTQRFYQVEAKFFSDCSGDSILAPLTNAEFRLGRECGEEFGEETHVKVPDKMTMGMSCLIQGVETQRPVRFIPPSFATKLTDSDVENRPMDPYKTAENFWYLELGGDRDTIGDTEVLRDELVALALGAWDRLKNHSGARFDTWELGFLGFLPGKRESRRMMGEYVITQKDISEDKVFADTVAFGGWPLDDHFPAGYYHKGTPNTDIVTPPAYCIPYRSLYSKNVDNLFFAGRNISMTHMAMSSIRVMKTCSLLGEAVGRAAAIAKEYSLTPHGVYLEKLKLLQDTLMDSDCFLPHFRRRVGELCRRTELSGGDGTLKNGEDRASSVYGTEDKGVAVKNGECLEYRFEEPESIATVHIVFDSDLNRESLPGDSVERLHSTRSNVLLDSPVMHMPHPLCKSFRLEAETGSGTVVLAMTSDNLKRAYHITADIKAYAVRLIPLSNWGNTAKTKIVSFDFT